MRTQALIFLGLFGWASAGQGEVCASRYSELNQTERLQSLERLLHEGGQLGLVNRTQGSYIVLEVRADQLNLVFYTSGLFDLYGIKREGPIQFCDDGKTIKMTGLDRTDELKILERGIQIGDGGPKREFVIGAMPPLLMKLHHLEARDLAGAKP